MFLIVKIVFWFFVAYVSMGVITNAIFDPEIFGKNRQSLGEFTLNVFSLPITILLFAGLSVIALALFCFDSDNCDCVDCFCCHSDKQ